MYKITTSTRFRKDMKKILKSGWKKDTINLIQQIIDTLIIPEALPKKHREHPL